jgi:hypothetical protein
VRVHRVKDQQVLLVQQSTTIPDSRGDCDTRVQALIVSSESVATSTAVARVAMCLPFQWDDAMFIGLTESTIEH